MDGLSRGLGKSPRLCFSAGRQRPYLPGAALGRMSDTPQFAECQQEQQDAADDGKVNAGL